jgi:hypothetical protein
MAKPQHDHLWALAHAERATLADDLSGLSDEQWRHRTLCGKWDVEEVVAHLTATASLGQWKTFVTRWGWRGHPGSTL